MGFALWRVALAAFIMGISVWLIQDLGMWIAIITGIITYAIALIALNALPGEEKRWMIENFNKLRKRFGEG